MFEYNFNKKYLYIFIAILAMYSLRTWTTTEFFYLLIALPAVIISITFHEFAHAFVADRLGDDTPRMQGRLTLNPLSHIDITGFILLIFAGFGWGKPVEINPRNFNRDINMDKGEMYVSLAGPCANFILAIIFAIIYGIIYMLLPMSFFYGTIGNIIYLLIQEIIMINIGLGIFNLIPLPPLDGSKIFINLFSYKTKRWLFENEKTFYIIFLLLWITNLGSYIIQPVINLLYSGLINGVIAIIRLF